MLILRVLLAVSILALILKVAIVTVNLVNGQSAGYTTLGMSVVLVLDILSLPAFCLVVPFVWDVSGACLKGLYGSAERLHALLFQ